MAHRCSRRYGNLKKARGPRLRLRKSKIRWRRRCDYLPKVVRSRRSPRIRGRQYSTVVSLVSDLVERGEVEFQSGWVAAEKQERIEKACAELGLEKLRPIKEALPSGFTYEEIRLVVARLRRESESG